MVTISVTLARQRIGCAMVNREDNIQDLSTMYIPRLRSSIPHHTLPKPRQQALKAIVLCSLSITSLTLLATPSVLGQNRIAQVSSERMLRTLTVSGQGTEKIAATLADVQLGIEAQGKTAQQVQEEVARRSSAVVALLKNRGVEKLQTTGINLSPQYNYDNGKQTLVGYQASNVVSFRVAANQAGGIMDAAVAAGASRIDSISFSATDQATADAQKVALRKATEDAQAQAKAVLSTLGLSPKEIVSIQVNNANVQPPIPYPVAAKLSAQVSNAPATPVEGGQQSIQASVTLQISY
jgi:hypothetical protein